MTQVAGPRHGVTVRAHIDGHLTRAHADLIAAMRSIQATRKIRPAAREELRKLLAGVVFDCESVRLWLDAGCPEG